jgi:hypothetical protein
VVAHVAIAAVVLWRGALLFQPGAGGAGGAGDTGAPGGGGRPAVSWFTLPTPSAPRVLDVPPAPPAPSAVIVPATALPDPVKLDVPRLAPPLLSASLSPPPPLAGTGVGAGGGPGTGPGTGTGVDAGPGSGGDGGYIPAFARGGVSVPECARGDFQVRLWVEVDGRVSRVEVDPSPKDPRCRREMLAQMKAYRFRPAMTRDGRPVASVYQIRLIHH